MKKLLFTILFIVGFAFSQTKNDEILSKHNISLGMLDDKTGLSLVGYTYNIKQTKMNEFFVGGGTMILAYTATAGWKHYYRKSRLSISSVLCGQYVASLGFMGYMSTASLTLEYKIVEWAQIKLGGSAVMFFDGALSDFGFIPFVGLNFSY